MNKELLIGQNATKEANNSQSSEIIKRVQIQNTPFMFVEYKGESFIALGNYRVTLKEEVINNVKEAEKFLKKEMWSMIPRVIAVINNDLKIN